MTKFVFKTSNVGSLKNKYDLIIIGSGATGLAAALQAKQLGLSPIILEKRTRLGGNSSRASSGMNAAETLVELNHHIVDSYEDFYNDTFIGGGKKNNPELLKYFVSHAALAINWLANLNIPLTSLTISGGQKTKRTHRPASLKAIGDFLIYHFLKVVDQANIPIFNKVKVKKLKMEDDSIKGIEVILPNQKKKIISTKAIILATGGFGASKQLVVKYRPDLKGYGTTNQPGATGDGIKLAQNIGASLVDMDQIQIHPTVQQDTDHTYLIGEAGRGEGAILVNKSGQRFVNELDTRKNVSHAITSLPEKSAYLILDQNIRNHFKAMEFYDQVGLVISAPSLSALAKKIQIDSHNFSSTIKTWNQYVANQKDLDFGRTTGIDRDISQAPFYAIHVSPAVHYTMGGVKINHKAQVLNTNNKPISGLFAGGEVTGGLHGNNRLGGNSISETVIFGRQAAQQVFKYLKSK